MFFYKTEKHVFVFFICKLMFLTSMIFTLFNPDYAITIVIAILHFLLCIAECTQSTIYERLQ